MTKKGFILSAGYGTRMGESGKIHPKILWPIFEKSLLELQVLYLKRLGASEIFMNTHHHAKKIERFVREKNLAIHILHEKNLLGTGGAFHYFKKMIGEDKVLAVNGDQFYFSSLLKAWPRACGVTLYGVSVEGEYEGLVVREGLLTSIGRPKEAGEVFTFSGTSVVDLKTVEYKKGISEYFHSVADYRRRPVFVKESPDSTYYDFGTLDRYLSSINRIIKKYREGERDVFVNFLIEEKALESSVVERFRHGRFLEKDIEFMER